MYTKFGDNILGYRKQYGLTQEAFAAKIVGRQLEDNKRDYTKSVSKWELGESYPEMPTLILIAEELNLTLDELVNTEAKYGVSPKIAQEIENMSGNDLEYLVGLYNDFLTVNSGGRLTSSLFIEKHEVDGGIRFSVVLQSGHINTCTVGNDVDIMETINCYLEESLEDLLQTSFEVNLSDCSLVNGSNNRYFATIDLLADYNAIKALMDEKVRRDKIAIKAKINA